MVDKGPFRQKLISLLWPFRYSPNLFELYFDSLGLGVKMLDYRRGPMRMAVISTAARNGLILAALSGSLASKVEAAEYGLGDYLLGYSIAMAGYTPPPGVYFQNTFYLYSGTASKKLAFPIGLNVDIGVHQTFAFNISNIAWFPDFKLLGGQAGLAVTAPFGAERTSADAALSTSSGLFRQLGRTEQTNALGDTALSALLGWQTGEHHFNLTLTGFVPTGYYSPSALSFTGLNRPAIDLKAAYTFLSLQTGTEVTLAPGMTFNTINSATNYQTGTEFHFEWAVDQHFPFGLAAGVGGYVYQQVTNDSGSGDQIGPFKGRVIAIGPLLNYTITIDKQQLNLSARWFHEFDVQNRVTGNSVFASLSFPL